MKLSDVSHAFITGGASGIGLGIADALAAHGMAVTIADIDRAGLESALAARSGDWRIQPLDTRDRDGWRTARAQAEEAFGPADILINNAGIGPDGRELADMSPDSFDRVISINLTGMFNGVSTFAAGMRARGRGHIVNTASMAGLACGMPGVGAYTVAKYGVVGMSETLRLELAPHGVGVSVLCPGFVPTRLSANTARLGGGLADIRGSMPDTGVTTADVAAAVLRGIESNSPYIITHPRFWPGVEKRFLALRDAFGG